jgi:predicted glycogen debranching enzyme
MTDSNRRSREWLETDGLGGFASGTESGVRTRRYHALLLPATTPPTGRMALVNGFDAWVTTDSGSYALTSQAYLRGVRHPDGEERVESFTNDLWPRWVFRLPDETRISQEVIAWRGRPLVALRFALEGARRRAILTLRPFLSGRDYHSLHHENPAFRCDAQVEGERVLFRPYEGLPPIVFLTNGAYRHDPAWYRNFLYEVERERGLDFAEDLASPGEIRFDLEKGEAAWILSSDPAALSNRGAESTLKNLRQEERRRRSAFPSPWHRAADAYLVRRHDAITIVAGYPWFTDWGRDTFIALRGLCLSSSRFGVAESILLEWADAVSEGMLPNRFPDRGETPEFNSVDASLWYIVAVEDFLARVRDVSARTRKKLHEASQAILEGYRRGTRYGIHADEDGLLAAGERGVQLTWMDATVSDWVVTPRIGKPVEVEALWLSALAFGSRLSKEWRPLHAKGVESFEKRFWNPEGGCLHDVVDVDHVPGTSDASFRPNQIFAVGGLPRRALVDRKKARSVVDAVESKLWTPMGLRSLSPEDPRYVPRYVGGVLERDGSYHQGTVWPWLAGAFIEAWVRVRGESAKNKKEARERFLEPLLSSAGAGHIAEIADAESPHTPRGCPFQAWSLGEVLRSLEFLEKPAQRALRREKEPRAARRPARSSPPAPSV